MANKKRLEEIKKELELDWSDISYVVNQNDAKWLIKRLEQVIGDLDENVAAFETLWLEEKRKNQRYKQTLEFYANEENYEPSEVQIGAITKEGYKISKYKYDPKINIDNGGKARQTLKGE